MKFKMAILFLLFSFVVRSEELKNSIADLGINMDQFGKLDFIKSNSREDKINKRLYTEKSYSNNNYKVILETVENIEQSYAESLIKLYRAERLGAYKNRRSPYTGESLTTPPCSKNNIPQVFPVNFFTKEADVLLLNASERNVFGVCQESLIQKKTIVFLGYNSKKKTFISIEIFIPRSFYKKEMLDTFVKQFKGDLSL